MIQSTEVQAEQERQQKQAAGELKLFADWQKALNEERGCSFPGLDAIGRSCIVAVIRALPYGQEKAYIDFALGALQQSIEQTLQAKDIEQRIRSNLVAANEQQAST